MQDHFDAKRGMVQKLLAMLKAHAANEVDSGLKKPEGEGDMHGLEVSHVEVLPEHSMDESTPEHDIREEEDQPHMAKGGVVDKVNATDPTPKIHSGPIPYEEANGHPDKEGSAHEEATESEKERETEGDIAPVAHGDYPDEQAEPSSMFASFLGKKKRK